MSTRDGCSQIFGYLVLELKFIWPFCNLRTGVNVDFGESTGCGILLNRLSAMLFLFNCTLGARASTLFALSRSLRIGVTFRMILDVRPEGYGCDYGTNFALTGSTTECVSFISSIVVGSVIKLLKRGCPS